jgi:class 3 adenylate cyclase/tetratricopeptide (TPR) repeat protein
VLSPYVPRLLVDWLRTAPDQPWRQIDGTLAFVDISGFTKITERLARKGKVGAEEMNDVLNACFTELLRVAYSDGAGLVKWGGDALLLLFQGENHAGRACRAAHGMRRSLRGMGRLLSSAGFVTLRMSVGIHSGEFDFFLVGDVHRELVLAGPAATHTVAMESAAEAGEILVSEPTARQLHPKLVGLPKGEGFLLKGAPNVPAEEAEPPPDASGLGLSRCLPVGIREHLVSGSGEPEHRHVSVAFIEFRGVDDCLRESGPDTLAAVLDRCIQDVQEACARHGVTFFETDIGKDGGKIMLVAGAPRSSGNDEAGMLNAVRRIMDRSTALPLRIGVNCGWVFAGDFGPPFRRSYSIKGDAVNLAARLMGKAEAGQILVTEVVLARSSTSFHAEPLEPFAVKGKARPVQAFALGAGAGRKAVDTTDLPLVGRDRELGVLLEGLEQANRRRGRVVELVGEPGIGKSRLVQELLSHTLDMTVVLARCEMYEASTPYFPFRAVLWEVLGIRDERDREMAATRLRDRIEANAPHLLPWLPLLGIPSAIEVPMTLEVEQLEDEFRRTTLIDVTNEFLGWVLPTTTVLVFDDVHWMDEASAELLRRLTEDAGGRPWLILVTRREEGEGFRLSGRVHTTLHLEPLGAADAAALVEAATERLPMPQHEMAAMAERSGGNPLFLRELVSATRSAGSVEALPDTVEGLITAQIDRLLPSDRTLLRTASVLGTSFSPEFLGEVLADEGAAPASTAWDRLREFVGEDEPGVFRFRHALIRDAAYEGLPFRRRRELHGRVGERIERAGGDEHAELLSLHFFKAEGYERAWRYSRVAGERAEAKYALVDAGDLYRRALEAAKHLPMVSPIELSGTHEALGDVRDRVGLYEEAARAYRNARRLISGDPVAEAKIHLKESRIRERLGKYRAALVWVTRGHRLLAGSEGREALSQRAQLSAWYAAIRQGQGRYLEVIRWCRRAIEEAEASGEMDALAHALFILDWAYMDLGELDKATNSPRALEIYDELGNLGAAATVLNNMGMFEYFRGQWDHAAELYERGRQLRLRIGDTIDAAMGTTNVGEILSDQGRLEEAKAMFADALRTVTAAGRKEGIAINTSNMGRLLSRSQRYDEALALFEVAGGMFEEMGDDGEVLETQARVAECHVFRGDWREALATCNAAFLLAREVGGVPPQLPLLNRVKAYALIQEGRLEEARETLQESLAAARARQADYEIGLTLRAMVEFARVAGDPFDDQAEAESKAILDRLGVVTVPDVPLPAPQVVVVPDPSLPVPT